MRYLSLFCLALFLLVGCRSRSPESKAPPSMTPAQVALVVKDLLEEAAKTEREKEEKRKDEEKQRLKNEAEQAKLKSDAEKKAAEDLRAEIKKEKDASDKAKENADKAKEALDGPLKKLQDRLEALEKAKGKPAEVKPGKSEVPGTSYGAWQNVERVKAHQKLLGEIKERNYEWWSLHHKVRVLSAIGLSFGNGGSLGALPREQYVFRGTYQYAVDWDKFDDSTKEVIKTKEEEEKWKAQDKKRGLLRDKVKEERREIFDRIREVEILLRWHQLYPLATDKEIATLAQYWLARAR